MSDSGSHSGIQKFDSGGNFITKWGSPGIGEGEFNIPSGIAVDSSGSVYVVDTYNYRIQKFFRTEVLLAPNTPSGPINGTSQLSYTYSTRGSSSHLGHPLEYRFDWGDGTLSDWSSSSAASKPWSSPGTYNVKSQARCALDTSIESYWSEPLSIFITSPVGPDLTGQWLSLALTCRSTMKSGPKCKISGKLTIENVGNQDATSSFVRFYLADEGDYEEGTHIFLKQVSTGIIRIGKSKMITFSYTFPFGLSASGKYMLAVIDADKTVAESNESNNYVGFGPIP